jgi:predicted ATPase
VVFRALDDALAGRPELADLLSPDARRRVLGPVHPAGAGLSWLEGATPGIERQRLFSSVARLVTTAARPAGLLLVVEDLHDADDGSLQLLTHLGQSVTREPVMVVLSHRTEPSSALARLRSVLLADRGTAGIRLDPLTRDGVASLVARLTEGSRTRRSRRSGDWPRETPSTPRSWQPRSPPAGGSGCRTGCTRWSGPGSTGWTARCGTPCGSWRSPGTCSRSTS